MIDMETLTMITESKTSRALKLRRQRRRTTTTTTTTTTRMPKTEKTTTNHYPNQAGDQSQEQFQQQQQQQPRRSSLRQPLISLEQRQQQQSVILLAERFSSTNHYEEENDNNNNNSDEHNLHKLSQLAQQRPSERQKAKPNGTQMREEAKLDHNEHLDDDDQLHQLITHSRLLRYKEKKEDEEEEEEEEENEKNLLEQQEKRQAQLINCDRTAKAPTTTMTTTTNTNNIPLSGALLSLRERERRKGRPHCDNADHYSAATSITTNSITTPSIYANKPIQAAIRHRLPQLVGSACLALLAAIMLMADGLLASGDLQLARASLVSTTGHKSTGRLSASNQAAYMTSWFNANKKNINMTHVTVDELTNSIYVGAINWIIQFNENLQVERVLKTGPVMDNARDCSPTDCAATIQLVEPSQLLEAPPVVSSPANNGSGKLSASSSSSFQSPNGTINNNNNNNQQQQQKQMMSNNYNKILVIDYDQRQLIVCGSVNQGACRRHQLGDIGNFSELIPLPVASNDESSSTVALITQAKFQPGPLSYMTAAPSPLGSKSPNGAAALATAQRAHNAAMVAAAAASQQPPVMYVAATNTRLGPYRELVPAISSRYLDSSRAMQIIDRSFTDSARVDISFHLRDYFLVNYVYAFQTQDYVYFATVQRSSHLRSLEEWGYITRLVRICLNDPGFQTYTEMSLQCVLPASSHQSSLTSTSPTTTTTTTSSSSSTKQSKQQNQSSNNSHQQHQINYNLLQDAHLVNASSHLAQQLGIRANSPVLIGAFSPSKDHTTRSQHKSAICLFPLEKIEQKFNENIHLCYNGSVISRNIDYIAGSVDECPKPGKAGNIANFCNEPIKLNGSVPLITSPVIIYDNDLITAIVSTTTAPAINNNNNPSSSPASAAATHSSSTRNNNNNQANNHHQSASTERSHQILVAGTHDGHIKKILIQSGDYGFGLRGYEFDSIQLDHQEPILADLALTNGVVNSPSSWRSSSSSSSSSSHQQLSSVAPSGEQFIVAASPYKLAKLRLNYCKHSDLLPANKQHNNNNNNFNQTISSSSSFLTCDQCAQLLDPYCGWCSALSACTGRQECLDNVNRIDQHQHHPQAISASLSSSLSLSSGGRPTTGSAAAWLPFDRIRCSDYRSLSQPYVALQQDQPLTMEVNINNQTNDVYQFPLPSSPAQLAQTQFTCHYEYPQQVVVGGGPQQKATQAAGYTVKAHQARLNQLTSTVTIGCPLPPVNHRPSSASLQAAARQLEGHHQSTSDSVKVKLTVRHLSPFNGTLIREFRFYDCSQHSSCRSCLQSGQSSQQSNGDWPPISHQSSSWSCSWCPTTNRCTHNVTHADYGCSLTNQQREPTGHLLNHNNNHHKQQQHQQPLTQLSQCLPNDSSFTSKGFLPEVVTGIDSFPSLAVNNNNLVHHNHHHHQHLYHQGGGGSSQQHQHYAINGTNGSSASASDIIMGGSTHYYNQLAINPDINLIHSMARRSITVLLRNLLPPTNRQTKFECLVEMEGAKAKMSAKLIDNNQIVCQESVYSYQEEVATLRAQVSIIMNELAVIERTEVILYKCHLFGPNQRSQVDCSLCATLDRRFQCAWCNNQCTHSDQCMELPSANCPPPRIDSIYPLSGPLEGGTIVVIEGSNLGSNEREIQDKVAIGGIPCQLVEYSVSVRIVCRTGASLIGPQSAVVVVGNRAGVTRAQEKFQYKAVHLTDVNPKFGPTSGGTRLYLTGSNLNIGSKISIYLDDIPCTLDRLEASNRQISCLTGQKPEASTSRITRLILNIDNSTQTIPYPFMYHPDPRITSISPIESFISGGRLLIVTGHHLAVPQTVKLMVYHEHYGNIINGSYCSARNDTWMMCLTPGISREMLTSVGGPTNDQLTTINNNLIDLSDQQHQQRTSGAMVMGGSQQMGPNLLKEIQYENGGLRLKMSLIMDDVKSVRQLAEHYPHLPHYITYFDDPKVYKFPTEVIAYSSDGIIIEGDNLKMAYLDEDIVVTVGTKVCTIISIKANQIICTPPQEPQQPTDEQGRPTERQLPQIVVTIGSNIRQELGYMQYEQSYYSSSSRSGSSETSSLLAGPQVAAIVGIGILVVGLAILMLFVVALSKYRNTKAEKEYKRIQLQMGSLDVNGVRCSGGQNGPIGSQGIDYTIGHHPNDHGLPSLGSPNNKKLLASYPPSPLTNFSTMSNSNQNEGHQNKASANHIHPHITKINGLTTNYAAVPLIGNGGSEQVVAQNNGWTFDNLSSSKSSPGGSPMQKSIERQLISNMTNHQIISNNLVSTHHQQQHNSNFPHNYQSIDRNSQYNSSIGRGQYNWRSDVTSTIVPYAIIEACNVGNSQSDVKKKDYV